MTPAFPLGGGISVPIWPIPIAFPALPQCAMDEIIALIDEFVTGKLYITRVFTPLTPLFTDCYDFVIPSYMVNGPVCPTDPNQRIDWVNCKDVGVSDGIQSELLLLFLFFYSRRRSRRVLTCFSNRFTLSRLLVVWSRLYQFYDQHCGNMLGYAVARYGRLFA